MADRIPIKTKTPGTGADGLCEFAPTDSVSISDGGTGAITAPQALTNLGAVSTGTFNSHANSTANPHAVNPTQIGAVANADKGVANGVASLDGGGKIPVGQIPAISIPSMHVIADATARLALTVQEGDEAKQLSDGSHWIYDGSSWHQYPSAGAPIFGSEFQRVVDLPLNVTTSTTFQLVAELNTTVLPSGEYRLGINYGWNHNSASNDFESEIRLNNVDLGEIHKQEPKDATGTFGSSGSSQRHYVSRVFYVTLSGSNNISLFFRSDTGGTASGIWDTSIELWRVS